MHKVDDIMLPGSQFFFNLTDNLHLDRNYTVFGRVVSDLSVADALEYGDRILGFEEVK